MLTLWPPGPVDVDVLISRSSGLISISTGSASGITATVAADVWMRPCASVLGTRCTRWTPPSYFSCEYAPWPCTSNAILSKPPFSLGETSTTSIFQPFFSAHLPYIRKRSAANSAASSPPSAPWISTITSRSSLGSFGRSRIFSFSSSSPT